MERKCEWCNKVKKNTVHHVKDRLGVKEEIYVNGHLVFTTMNVCRQCHDEIERDYELIGKVVTQQLFRREGTLGGIEHNIPIRMSYNRNKRERRNTRKWLQKKIQKVHGRLGHDKSCRSGLYYTQQMNIKPYRECIMKLAIALNDMRVIERK